MADRRWVKNVSGVEIEMTQAEINEVMAQEARITPRTPEPSPIEIRLAALEAKTGVTEADKLAARETLKGKRDART